ncbi:MAG: hypothetical protein Fur0010_06250 [Bdellovibrio sp.]
MLLSLPLFAGAEEVARAIYVKGAVKFIHNEVQGILQQGQSLEAGDEIITGKNDLVILSYVNNSKIKIDPSSHIIIDDLAPSESGHELTLFVKLGNLMIQFFNPNKDSQLQVRAKNTALGVRGTRFLLGVDEIDNNVHVSVDEGDVLVMSTEEDDHESVQGGQSIVVEEGRRLTKPFVASWINKMDWSMGNTETGFNRKEVRALRVQEFLKRRPQLLQRRAQFIAPLLKQRFQWSEKQKFKGLPKKEALKKYLQNNKQSKKDDKNRRRLKDRVKERIKKRKEVRERTQPSPPQTRPPTTERPKED